jgi:hypothetical protein
MTRLLWASANRATVLTAALDHAKPGGTRRASASGCDRSQPLRQIPSETTTRTHAPIPMNKSAGARLSADWITIDALRAGAPGKNHGDQIGHIHRAGAVAVARTGGTTHQALKGAGRAGIGSTCVVLCCRRSRPSRTNRPPWRRSGERLLVLAQLAKAVRRAASISTSARRWSVTAQAVNLTTHHDEGTLSRRQVVTLIAQHHLVGCPPRDLGDTLPRWRNLM